MPYVRYKDNGCRAETLFGVWFCEESRLEQMRDTAMSSMERGEFATISQRSEALSGEMEKARYVVQDGIARINVHGPISKYETSMMSMFGGTSTVNLVDTLREIRQTHKEKGIKSVFIDFDTPGGTAAGTSEAADAIRKTDAVLPVYGHASDQCASAGMWLASSCRRLTCGPTAAIGSVGSKLVLWEKKRGPEDKSPRPVVISTGKFKTMGDDGTYTPEQIAEVTRFVTEVNEQFKSDVIQRRKLTAEQAADVMTARVYVGKGAKEIGLVDEVCSTDDAFEEAKRLTSTAGSGPGVLPPTVTAAPKKGSAMALTEAQLQQARMLPGAAAITAENADVVLLGVVQTLQQSQPKTLDPEIVKHRFEMFSERLNLKVEKGLITTAQKDAVIVQVQQAGQPIAEMFSNLPNGKRPADILLESFDGNKPNGLTQEQTGMQPAPRETPGAGKDAAKLSLDRLNVVRERNGLAPLSAMPEYLPAAN
jgi:signal peptide peptidase SppA